MRAAILAMLTITACARPEPYEPPAPSEPVEVEEPAPECETLADVGVQAPRDDFPAYCEGAEVDNQFCAGFTGRCYECRLIRPDVVEWVLTSDCHDPA
jgi:hypothetical protein